MRVPILLRAGALELQLSDGQLIAIAAGDVEIWRSVMFLYRDPAWATPRYAVTDVSVDARDESFVVRLQGNCPAVPALRWTTDITGFPDGRVLFVVEAQVRDDLMTSRTGICVLHPASAAGQSVEVELVDGRLSRSRFPQRISPWQPFTQIRALCHRFAPGCWASCRFDGDDFEMEDQRNFSDASYKTYSRSNLMPRPFHLDAGSRVRQSVMLELELERVPRLVRRSPAQPIPVDVSGAAVGRMPALGLWLQPDMAISSVAPDFCHVRLDLRLGSTADVGGALACVMRHSRKNVPLRVDLVLADDDQVEVACRGLSQACTHAAAVVAELGIFPTTERAVRQARAIFPGARIGGGTPFFFTHLNRWVLPPGLDFVSYATCPIVHVADDLSLMQSLATLPEQVRTLRQRTGRLPLQVGPIGIGMSLDPFGVQLPPSDGRPIAMARTDARDAAPFGQAWMLGYLCRMLESGVHSLTLAQGATFDGLRALAGRAGQAPLALRHPQPERLAALALRDGDTCRIWLANLTDQPLAIGLRLPGSRRRQERALAPYALCCDVFSSSHQKGQHVEPG